MVQVEAVIKMLAPDFSVAGIAANRRNKSNPWFKRGTLFRNAVDTLEHKGWVARGGALLWGIPVLIATTAAWAAPWLMFTWLLMRWLAR